MQFGYSLKCEWVWKLMKGDDDRLRDKEEEDVDEVADEPEHLKVFLRNIKPCKNPDV